MNLNHHGFSLEDETLPLRIAHKQIGGKEVFYIINDFQESIRTGVSLQAKGKLEEWAPVSGEIRKVSNTPDIELLPYHGKIDRSR